VAPERDVTSLLVRWGKGDANAFDELAPIVYDELRKLARTHLRRERPGHTLQSTALVHEAYLRMIDQQNVSWQNRSHFYGIAAQMIRRILVDYARAKNTKKRGEAAPKITFDEAVGAHASEDLDLVALDDALKALAEIDPRQSRIVELRYFAGLSIEDTAEVLRISPATVKRDWTVARAWLKRELVRGATRRVE
jgi:RNA polymerase sigma factor (TIGR02999 family)